MESNLWHLSTDTVFGFISEFVVGGNGEVGDIGAMVHQ
jgi:hypothetical protein